MSRYKDLTTKFILNNEKDVARFAFKLMHIPLLQVHLMQWKKSNECLIHFHIYLSYLIAQKAFNLHINI